MTKTSVLISFLVLTLNIECKKKEDKPTIDVSQITTTNALGNILSEDNTDWTKDDNWTAQEEALFQTPPPAQLVNTQTAPVSISPAYPNPASTQQFLAISNSQITYLEIVITDNNLLIKQRLSFVIPGNAQVISYLLDSSIYFNNTNYRLYYGFYSLADGLFYKGHGDIKLSR